MPRKEIELPHRLEYLSILDEHAKLDKELEPRLDKEFLLKLHRGMLLGRRFDERLLQLQRQGRMGTFAPIQGQEASQIGAVAALDDADWLVPSFREMAAELWRGKKMEQVILLYAGYNEGGEIPPHLNNLPVAIPVGTQTLHAAGIAYAIKYRGKQQVAMSFFGDGATSEGDFHEALNFAGVYQVPAVFICQNNHWAISIPRKKQTHAQTLAQKAVAYGIPGVQVDGNDVLAVYTAAREAVDRARAGGGPTLIECVTYRMSVHTTADDPKRYRQDVEVEEWVARDPLVRFQDYLKGKKILTDKKIEAIEQEIRQEIKEAVERTEKMMERMGDPLLMFDHVYAERPPYLEEQRQELERELQDDGQ